MATDSMLARFEGEEGRRRLIGQLRKQSIVGGDSAAATDIAEVAKIGRAHV